jgi:methyl-accepting chemotaxis protein
VASEVRALAQRSAEAAKEIKGLITSSKNEVDSGVKLVAETGESLDRIVGRVGEINSVVADISAGATEQATALGEVNTAVNQMDQTTQQNAAMAEQATAAGQSMAAEAGKLTAAIGQFKLGGDDRVRSELKRVAPHAFASPSKPAPRRGAPEPRPAKKGAAARASTGGSDSWNEF